MNQVVVPTNLDSITGMHVYPNSITPAEDAVFFMARGEKGKYLGILARPGSHWPAQLAGERVDRGDSVLVICPLNHANAQALRNALPWLRPHPLGLQRSAGCGDRLGLATPGHVRAARQAPGIAMIFAQQSIREMTRTGRTPEQVMDDATWGIFQEGWREGVGADADHLKTTADIERCVAVGFTLYTIDPGDHVDSAADTDDESAIRAKYDALPWETLDNSPRGLATAYIGKQFDLGDRALTFDEEGTMRAAVKYGRAIAHVVTMYRHLKNVFQAGRDNRSSGPTERSGHGGDNSFELEVSVDETETPTSHLEHLFIASELKRLGVQWVSLAPRYIGRFEKGVDYIGDLAEFERDFAGHAAIARACGPYKLSLHSGSDKFSIYQIAAEHAQGLVHLKTAGTSYLEALRAVTTFDPALFRDILAFARLRYPEDRASYHVSAELRKVPNPEQVSDADLPGLLDQFDTRQVLHVTFGSVLKSNQSLRERLLAGLSAHEEAYYAALERHFVRHLQPLVGRR